MIENKKREVKNKSEKNDLQQILKSEKKLGETKLKNKNK